MAKKRKNRAGRVGGPRPMAQPRRSGPPVNPSHPTPPASAASIQGRTKTGHSAGVLATPLFDSLPTPPAPELIDTGTAERERVPMEYRAQAQGRCQRQYPKAHNGRDPDKTDLHNWIDEWVERIDPACPFRGDGMRLIEVQVDWRLISNSGIDEDVVRPVLGGRGWPMIPGSGIKGLFRRACSAEQAQHWCGSRCGERDSDLRPGILRFHGAWPLDNSWTHGLLDVAHPQQNWQLGFEGGGEGHSANGVVSLLRPRLCIAISSTGPKVSEQEWQEIKTTLRAALDGGLGGRTCAGYGTTGKISGEAIFQCRIEGQGPASKLLTDEPEFRPSMFRAAIRDMALRLFGGLTDASTTLQVVGKLLGSVDGKGEVGLLSTAYTDGNGKPELASFQQGRWLQPNYATTGLLQWRLMRRCRYGEDEALLRELLAGLHGLVMTLGGFGKSWRRPDHRIFYADYYRSGRPKPLIGCHWQWREVNQLPPWIHVQSAAELIELLRRTREVAGRWLEATGTPTGGSARWREVIHPQAMKIWIRTARDADDAEVVEWFHNELKGTVLGGKVNQVGRLWNRLLPLLDGTATRSGGGGTRPANPLARPANPMARPAAMARPSSSRKPAPPPRGNVSINVHPGPFLETVVLFPEQRESPEFIRLMNEGKGREAGFRPVVF